MIDTAKVVQKLVRISHGYPITILKMEEYNVAIGILVYLNLMYKTTAIRNVVRYTGKFRRPTFVRDVTTKIVRGINSRDEVAVMLLFDMINTLQSFRFSDVTIKYGPNGLVKSVNFD